MYFTVLFIVLSLAAFGVQEDEPVCPANDGTSLVYIPHDNCTKFYECSHGVPNLLECPDGLHFNPELKICDQAERAGCDSSEENDSSQSSESSEENDSSNSSESLESNVN